MMKIKLFSIDTILMKRSKLRIIEYQCKGNKSEKSSYSQERANYPNILSQITDPVNKPKVVVPTKASKNFSSK